MALLEIDEVVIDGQLLAKAKAGDKYALKELRRNLDGIELSTHAFPAETIPNAQIISLRELERDLNIISLVTLTAYPQDWP